MLLNQPFLHQKQSKKIRAPFFYKAKSWNKSKGWQREQPQRRDTRELISVSNAKRMVAAFLCIDGDRTLFKAFTL
jgi:hypothetical protein